VFFNYDKYNDIICACLYIARARLVKYANQQPVTDGAGGGGGGGDWWCGVRGTRKSESLSIPTCTIGWHKIMI